MTTDQLYYAIGSILTGGAVVSLLATWIIERRERRKARRSAG
jgi:hypothetical protein